MMDQRQPDDVKALAGLSPIRISKPAVIHCHIRSSFRIVWTPASQQLRITLLAGGPVQGPVLIESMSEEFPVADIVVQCPRTGTPVPTGLKTEWVFLRSLPRVAIPLRCPACGQTHKWQPHEAWIAPTLQASAANSGLDAASTEASQR
jgi:hypothetical protein